MFTIMGLIYEASGILKLKRFENWLNFINKRLKLFVDCIYINCRME